jgi:hypothetical protein
MRVASGPNDFDAYLLASRLCHTGVVSRDTYRQLECDSEQCVGRPSPTVCCARLQRNGIDPQGMQCVSQLVVTPLC